MYMFIYNEKESVVKVYCLEMLKQRERNWAEEMQYRDAEADSLS